MEMEYVHDDRGTMQTVYFNAPDSTQASLQAIAANPGWLVTTKPVPVRWDNELWSYVPDIEAQPTQSGYEHDPISKLARVSSEEMRDWQN